MTKDDALAEALRPLIRAEVERARRAPSFPDKQSERRERPAAELRSADGGAPRDDPSLRCDRDRRHEPDLVGLSGTPAPFLAR
jgi:hypothetical protein